MAKRRRRKSLRHNNPKLRESHLTRRQTAQEGHLTRRVVQ
jgi:hypothetical protein